jgi:lysophospholipase L1-like esterase
MANIKKIQAGDAFVLEGNQIVGVVSGGSQASIFKSTTRNLTVSRNATDADDTAILSNGTANNYVLTLTTELRKNFGVSLVQSSTGTCTLAAGAGVTLIGSPLATVAQGDELTATWVSANTYVVRMVRAETAYSYAEKKYRRPPKPSDNATQGYGASSMWQYGGKVYQPVAAPSTASATWGVNQRRAGMITDIVGTTNTKFAGGTVAMKGGFTGAAIDISVTIASTPTAATINIIADGELDTDTLESYLCRMDAGTYCTVTKVYDQTGNGNHLTKHASYAGLLLDFDALIGRYVITSEYVSGGVDRRLEIPAIIGLARNAFGMVFYGRSINSSGNNDGNVVAVLGNYSGGANQISPLQLQNNGGMMIAQNPTGGNLLPASTVPALSNMSVFGVTGGGTNTTFFSNEASSATATNSTSSLATGGWVGSDGASQHFFPSRIVGMAICVAEITTAQISAIVEGAVAKFDIYPQARDRVVLLGDSRFSGAFAPLHNSFATVLPQHLQSDCEVINFSNGSKQISDIIAGTAVTAQGIYRSGVKNVAVILAGVNNFIVGNKTAAATLAEMVTLVSMLKTTGYKVLVISELATTSTTNNANTRLAELNVLLSANSMGADKVVDVYGYTAVATPANSAYYPDGLHPGAATYQLIASVVAPEVDKLLMS